LPTLLDPNSPGCWIRYPSGCPNQKHREKYDNFQDPTIWNYENFNGASESQDKCIARRSPINNWCGVSDVIIKYQSASDCPNNCFHHCLKKYGGTLLKGKTYFCIKGCAGVNGGKVQDYDKYCCSRNFEVCKDNCKSASARKSNIEKCEFGCTFWIENQMRSERCDATPTTEVQTTTLATAKDQCPVSHPYAYSDGQYCCASDYEKIYEPLGTKCDGSKIQLDSKCCHNDENTPCPRGTCTNAEPLDNVNVEDCSRIEGGQWNQIKCWLRNINYFLQRVLAIQH